MIQTLQEITILSPELRTPLSSALLQVSEQDTKVCPT